MQDIRCKKCGNCSYVKSGYIRNSQRYKCKECRCNFKFDDNSEVTSVWHWSDELDIYNGYLPDVGISGYEHLDVYPIVASYDGGRPGILYSDEFGRFTHSDANLTSCISASPYNIISYEYED